MARSKPLVSEARNYLVTTVAQTHEITRNWLSELNLQNVVKLGLAEVDDRYHIWRVPLMNETGTMRVGEVVIDAYTSALSLEKTTRPEMIEARLLKKDETQLATKSRRKEQYTLSDLRNTIALGDCIDLLDEMPAASVDLIFTSPPYFNARPEYSDYEEYQQYLLDMRKVISRCHRVMNEGRFFVMNTSPVLLRRANRNEASRRIAVPFDLHNIFIEEGFDFIDDIIWVKPEGAGWATGRGRRFAADRNPLQYKAVPVTEYLMVYRKKTDLLIDWHIRNHPDRQVVEESKVGDDYERTNIWRIQPSTNSKHPAAFPQELAEKVITYYSFKKDCVLDPFAGSGTVGAAAAKLRRRFVLMDNNPTYVQMMREAATGWLGGEADEVLHINRGRATPVHSLFREVEGNNV